MDWLQSAGQSTIPITVAVWATGLFVVLAIASGGVIIWRITTKRVPEGAPAPQATTGGGNRVAIATAIEAPGDEAQGAGDDNDGAGQGQQDEGDSKKDEPTEPPPRLLTAAAIVTFAVTAPLLIGSFFLTRWVDESQAGLSSTKAYKPGAYAAPLERLIPVERSGIARMTSSDSHIEVTITYQVIDPEKLPPVFNEISGFAPKNTGSKRDLLEAWISWKAQAFVPALSAREIKDADIDKVLGEVTTMLEKYGIESRMTINTRRMFSPDRR